MQTWDFVRSILMPILSVFTINQSRLGSSIVFIVEPMGAEVTEDMLRFAAF